MTCPLCGTVDRDKDSRAEPALCNHEFEVNDRPSGLSPDVSAGCFPDPLSA